MINEKLKENIRLLLTKEMTKLASYEVTDLTVWKRIKPHALVLRDIRDKVFASIS